MEEITTASPSAEPAQVDARSSRRVEGLQRQVDEVKSIMQQNVERVLERGERLDDLMDKSTDLEQTSHSFRATSHRVKRHLCLANLRCTLILFFIAIVVLTGIILVVLYECGVLTSHSSHSQPHPTASPPN